MLRGCACWVCSLRGSFERIVGDTFVVSSVGYSRPSTFSVGGRATVACDLSASRGHRASGERISAMGTKTSAFVWPCFVL